jgi:DnaJ-class molecular chaperone
MKYHPDRNKEPGSEDKFKEAKEAYELLSDSVKRQEYDQFGHREPFAHGNTRNTWSWNNGTDADNFTDIFDKIFKNRPFQEAHFTQSTHTNPRQEINVITINLTDAYIGRSVQVDKGATIHIPKGVRSGTRLYSNGKIYRVDVQPHVKYKRSNDDLLVDIEISSIEAILGVEAVLEHLDGVKLQFNIPAGIQNGQIVKLTNKGMKNPETDRIGDMMVRITIVTPRNLTEEEKTAIKSIMHRTSINI